MVRLSLDKNGLRRFASASTRCKTYVSNARLTLLPRFQRTWAGLNAEPIQSVCARVIQSVSGLPRRISGGSGRTRTTGLTLIRGAL